MNTIRRFIIHPVMGWYATILLATIVAIPPTYFLWSPSTAQWVSIGGMLIAMLWGVGNVAWDAFFKPTNSG